MRLGLPKDPSLTRQKVKPGTVRRIVPYALRYRGGIALLVVASLLDAGITVSIPLLIKRIIDDGILRRDVRVVVTLSLIAAALALGDALVMISEAWLSGRIGQGITYDLRTQVFRHVQQQSLAFFTRAQTGSLVSRLNTDVVLAQQAITTLLSTVVSSLLALAFVLVTMFLLSWQVTVTALVIIAVLIVPARMVGRLLQRLTRETMQRTAEMASLMNERFNVAGAMLAKLYGRPEEEARLFDTRAGRVREVGVMRSVYGQGLFVVLTLLAAWATALVYGLGGDLVIRRYFQLGTLVALAALLGRVYGPVSQLSSFQVNVMTALVSFDRTFEVLDLKPLVAERSDAVVLPVPSTSGATAVPNVEFEGVTFRYPTAVEASLASLESIARPSADRAGVSPDVLHDISFVAPAGQLTALVGPSGSGKTTITHLVSRMYDATSGAVRIDGHDVRDLTLASLRHTVGVVTQEAHLFHDTVRGNLAYARPTATETEIIEACQGAQIWDLISALPDGLDTVVGDRGYRLSGGEKQRIALARLLLKAPSVVVLDEATAHLDSESEAAVQRALRTALAGRTSLVIAHRLSTIREASQILVVKDGRIAQRGTHGQLLADGGPYADLYRIQFAGQDVAGAGSSGFDRVEPPAPRPAS